MTTPTWQDRRFMWQKGKHIHEPSRRMSQSGDKDTGVVDAVQQAAAAAASPFSMSKPNNSENPFIKKAATSPVTTLPSPPLRDRHVIWTKGKEVHEGTRRPSVPGEKTSDADLSTADRRRSSATSTSSQSGMMGSIFGYRTKTEAVVKQPPQT